ncbi:hypothetical protein AGMMS4956_18360 [Bacteroidia bacterium]|nr:hypothetical protein AGMMS4956_18360 [Bacteroidia bacterium]
MKTKTQQKQEDEQVQEPAQEQEHSATVEGYPINADGTPAYRHEQVVMLEALTAGYAHAPYDPNFVRDAKGVDISLPRYVNGAWTYESYPVYVPTDDDIKMAREAQYRQRSDSLLLAGMRKNIEAGLEAGTMNDDIALGVEEVAKIKKEFPYNSPVSN